MEQKTIIPPVDKALLKKELTPERQLRMTNKSHNEIYIVTAHNAPNTLREIGRLREIVFREAGGGTGKELDLDENGQPILATSHMFHFSEKFIHDYLPQTIELGRSFVSLPYQNTNINGAKSLFALDNLWDGLGALTVIKPNVKYFFGKMTMYPSYIRKGRDMILYFLKKHFNDKDNLIIPMKPLKIEADEKELAINDGFGDVEETGILIAVDEILEQKRVRHIESFVREHPDALKITSGANKVIYKEK